MPPSDVRIRLSAEGERDVVAALKLVESQSKKSAGATALSFDRIKDSIGGVKGALTALAGAAAVGALVGLAKAGSEVADQLGKASQRVGASVENLSALRIAAVTADVDMDTLQATLVKFNKRVAELKGGAPDAVNAFKSIGVSVKDFNGLDAAERFDVVAKAVGRLKDSPAKTAIAFQLFGRQAAQLIPLLNDLSENGLEGARVKAEALGQLFTEETAAAAQQVNDDFSLLQATAQGLGAQFVQGLGPSLHDVLTSFTGDVGDSASAWKTFGEEVGVVVKTVLLNLINILDIIVSQVIALGQALGGVAAAGAALFVGKFQEAGDIMKAVGDQFLAGEKALGARLVARAALAQTAATAPTKVRSGAQGIDADDSKLFEKEKKRAREREAHEQSEKQQDAAVITRFKAFAAEADAALQTVEERRRAIQESVSAGLTSQIEGQKQIADLEKSRLPVLQQLAEQLKAAAEATGDPDAIAKAQAYAASIGSIAINVQAAANVMGRLKAAATDALTQGIASALTNAAATARNFGEAMRQVAAGVVSAIQQIIAQELALLFVQKLLGFAGGGLAPSGGGGLGRAAGGLISGPGSGTSDSIPAMLSAGEFVVKSSVVQQPGVLAALQSLNRGTPALGGFTRARRFADGGLVAGAGVARSENSLVVGLEPGLVVRELKTPSGQRAVVQALARNPRGASSALQG